MAYRQKFTVAGDVSGYFCDPQRHWLRGKTLIRSHCASTSGREKPLGFQTPADDFKGSVALIG